MITLPLPRDLQKPDIWDRIKVMESMEPEFNSPKESPLEKLQNVIKRAPENIEREYTASPNSWTACFKSILTVLLARMQLYENKLRETLPPEGYERALGKLRILIEEAVKLEKQFPAKEHDPPAETKQALLDKLDIFN